MDDDDLCDCECHASTGYIHFTPCCAECPYCDDSISLGRFDAHLRRHCLMLTASLVIGATLP